MKNLDIFLPLTKTERTLIVFALEEAIAYWEVTDLDGVRDSPANQKRIAATRKVLAKIRTFPSLK